MRSGEIKFKTGRERKKNKKSEIIRVIKRKKIDIEDLWERTMFEERKINITARKIMFQVPRPGKVCR